MTYRQPQKRALIITYIDSGLKKDNPVLKKCYEQEGFKARMLFLDPTIPKKTNTENKTSENEGELRIPVETANNLRENLAWLQEAKNTVLYFNHHGLDPIYETPEVFQGSTTATILFRLGLDKADLKEMRIEFGACFGGRQQSSLFFNTLHELGAGNFIGRSRINLNGILITKRKGLSKKELDRKISDLLDKIRYYNEHIVDTRENPHIDKNTKIPINKAKFDKYQKWKKKVLYLQHNYEDLQHDYEIGHASNGEFIDDEFKTISQTPMWEKDENNFYKNIIFHLVGPKTETSTVEETQDPKRLIDFLMGLYPGKTKKTPERSTVHTV